MAKNNTFINDLTKGSVTKQLFRFALPFVAANILQSTYNIVDMIVIGRVVGSTGLAAATVGGELTVFLTCLCMGFTSGGQVMIAQCVGSGNRKMISRIIGTLATFLFICALVITAISLIFAKQFLVWMNVSEEAWKDTLDYSMVSYAGILFAFGYNAVSACLRGMGDSKRPMLFIGIAAATNVVLDITFVAGFGWAGFGAALATVIGQAVSFITAAVYLYKKRDKLGFEFEKGMFRLDREVLKPLVKQGVPLALKHGALNFSVLIVNSMINSYGYVVTAVTGVGSKLSTIQSIFTNTISQATAAMDGQNLGAGKVDRVKKITGISTLWSAIAVIVFCTCLILFPRQIFSVFTDDPAVLDLSVKYVFVMSTMYIGFMLQTGPNGVVTAAGAAGFNMLTAIVEAVIGRLLVAWLLGTVLGFGIMGFWYASALSPTMAAVFAWAYYIKGSWKTKKLLIETKE